MVPLCYVRTTLLMQMHWTASFPFLLFNSSHCSQCTIQSDDFSLLSFVQYNLLTSFTILLYDINLRATHTTIPSTRGVEIHISLVSSATDSIQRRVVVFKAVTVPTSDLKSEFLCQSSSIAQKPQTPPKSPCTPGISPTPSSPHITHTVTVPVLSLST